ncbi:hypothetical protein TNCV_740191 [Trichonephila clavipes]|nr:hypothetical protein TNCV_740191 [Trichonephila clavipes]
MGRVTCIGWSNSSNKLTNFKFLASRFRLGAFMYIFNVTPPPIRDVLRQGPTGTGPRTSAKEGVSFRPQYDHDQNDFYGPMLFPDILYEKPGISNYVATGNSGVVVIVSFLKGRNKSFQSLIQVGLLHDRWLYNCDVLLSKTSFTLSGQY